MKVMFLGTIRNKQNYSDAFWTIIKSLEKSGNEVFHEHVTGHDQVDLDNFSKEDNVAFHNDVMAKIRNCDVVVAECSFQSLSVGYLISYAVEQSKPTIIFYTTTATKSNLFPTLSQSEKLLLVEYTDLAHLADLVPEYFEYAKLKVDVRFNFFISPQISTYLEWVTKSLKIPRSVYLRQLIEDDMKKRDKLV